MYDPAVAIYNYISVVTVQSPEKRMQRYICSRDKNIYKGLARTTGNPYIWPGLQSDGQIVYASEPA
jgi:hypothetical protein